MRPRRRRRSLRALCVALLVAATAVGCLPEPTPPVERPADLEPIANGGGLPGAGTVRQPGTQPHDDDAPVAGPLALGMIASAALVMLELRPDEERDAASAERRPLGVLAVTANTRAELNLCDCKNRPRGGLARRASAIAALRQLATDAGERPIVLDVGDALADKIGAPTARDAEVIERAEVILDAFGVMKLDAMLVNTRDLRVERARLAELADEHGVPLISSNLVDARTQRPAFTTGRLVERGDLKLGIVGLTAAPRTNPRFMSQLGLTLLDAEEAIASASQTLETRGADAIVLLSGLGLRETQTLLERWEGEHKPDLALVAGTSRLTSAPDWAGDVAVLEPGDRGRQLLVVRMHPDERGELSFKPAAAPSPELAELINAVRRVSSLTRSVETSLRGGRGQPGLNSRMPALRRAVDEVADSLDALDAPPEPPRPPTLEVEVVELPFTLVPDASVQKRVDRVETEKLPEDPKQTPPP